MTAVPPSKEDQGVESFTFSFTLALSTQSPLAQGRELHKEWVLQTTIKMTEAAGWCSQACPQAEYSRHAICHWRKRERIMKPCLSDHSKGLANILFADCARFVYKSSLSFSYFILSHVFHKMRHML